MLISKSPIDEPGEVKAVRIPLLMVFTAGTETKHLTDLLSNNGYQPTVLSSWEKVASQLDLNSQRILLCDEHSLPPDDLVFASLQRPPLICLSYNQTPDFALRASRQGVSQLLLQPVSDAQLLASVALLAGCSTTSFASVEYWQGLEKVLNASEDAISVHDPQRRIVSQNFSHRQLFGELRGELCFRAIQKCEGICDHCAVTSAFEDGQVHKVEHCRQLPGEERCFESIAAPIPNLLGEVEAVIEIMREITLRKRAEKEVAYRQALESLIARISRKFIELSNTDFATGIKFALAELGRFTGAGRCRIYLLGKDWKGLTAAYSWASDTGSTAEGGQQIELSSVPWLMEKMSCRETLHVSNLSALPAEADAERDFFTAEGLISLVAVPLTACNHMAGILCVGTGEDAKEWGANDISLLQTVGEIVSNALERAWAAQSLQSALEDLAVARDNTESIIKSVSDGIIVTDRDGVILTLNQPACRLAGIKLMTEAQGQPLSWLIDRPEFFEGLQQLLHDDSRDSLVMDLMAKGQGDEQLICQARSSVVRNPRGEKTGVVTILQDVTRARELERMKTHFVSTAAHELRTPLTSIIGYAEFLLKPEFLDDFGDDRQREFLGVIMEQGEALSRIVDDLLDVSRIESGRAIPLDKCPCNLQEKIRRCVQHYQMQSNRHRFVIQTTNNLPAEMTLDCHKVGQVLENLYSNAVKYSPRGGLILTRLERQDDLLRIMIEDEGVGMTPEQVERVFDKFFRADDITEHAIRGLGLGMNIVRHIVLQHGGKIWVESEPGKGTRVFFTLPLD